MSKKIKYILIISLIIMFIIPIWVYASPIEIDPRFLVEETTDPPVDRSYYFVNMVTAIFRLAKYVYSVAILYLLIETIVIWKKEKVENKFIIVLNSIINVLISVPIGLTCAVIPTITNFIKIFNDNKKTKIKMNIITITIFAIVSFAIIPILIMSINPNYYMQGM